MSEQVRKAMMRDDFQKVLNSVRSSSLCARALRQEAMELLSQLPGYNWCGIYRLEGQELILDAFVGTPTEHERIPIGRGVCGTAVSERRNIVVEDVRVLSNYLACSLETRSEIVVLIQDGDQILGQIDIDGHAVGNFVDSDEQFLGLLAQHLASSWEEV